MEWQADQYASYLLMPRHLVMEAWKTRFGSHQPFVFDWVRSTAFNPGLMVDGVEVSDGTAHILAGFDFDLVARPFAQQFKVSIQAMRIRLEKLGLLLLQPPRQEPLALRS